MDSTATYVERVNAGRTVLPIAFDYGQRHKREIHAARLVAEVLGAEPLKVVNLLSLQSVASGSSQLGDLPVPHGHYADETMKATVVPNRNMIMLALASAYAISEGAAEVAYAAHAGDHAIYPDCRPQFAEAMRTAMALCDYDSRAPLLVTPWINSSKADIASWGAAHKVPFYLTYSCYEGREKHCGLCGTCVERKEAFQLAGLVDFTEYEA